MKTPQNGLVSFWWQELGRAHERARLESDIDADVCIVGAGLTGLWTAYYLKQSDPSTRVVIVEARFAGFGASGRNGGWLTNSVTGGVEQYVKTHGRDAAVRQQSAMNDTVSEVVAVARREGIDADINHGGELIVARNPAQFARVQNDLASAAQWPGTDWVELGRDDLSGRLKIAGALGGMWQPHCATIHPAKLVTGLAAAVERSGVTIYENSAVEHISTGHVRTARGSVRAASVIRATEGFTARLPGQRRTWLPMNSSMITTDPIPDEVWSTIGWQGGEALGDAAHMYIYAQRTADDRIAIGGRGKPYRYGSRIDADGQTPETTIKTLRSILTSFFPATEGMAISHAWSGVLGVPRDWSATVGFDRSTGMGYAGGYVGTGVTSTNLAGRTLADLALGHTSERTTLPWVDHQAKKWEVEPLRWLGVQSIYSAYRAADRAEADGSNATSPWARLAGVVSGRS